MNVVIDTSVFIKRTITPRSKAAQIFQRAKQGEFRLLVSEPILAEYKTVLGYPHIQKRCPLTPEHISRIIKDIKAGATLVAPTQQLSIVKDDPKDNKFFECAVAGKAHYIVSDDEHILNIGEYQGIIVVLSDVFRSLFGEE